MYYLDPRIENLYRIFDQNARKDYLRLDLNENPGGLPQEFINKVLSQVDGRFVLVFKAKKRLCSGKERRRLSVNNKLTVSSSNWFVLAPITLAISLIAYSILLF